MDIAPAALATADRDGRPSSRIVLIRHVDARGFVFHTNYNSRKGRELIDNPRAALCIHWPALEEQIRVEGAAERITADESDLYFQGRPRGSQIGAWASDQSEDLPSRAALEARTREIEERYAAGVVPRPPHWGGIRVVPDRIEFWYGRPDRLHDRVLYVKSAGTWTTSRLYP
ncbi:MAG: pyridoxamine 5'-phosphate oxidase [Acidobacteria bacterium]|nr:pyridoxamine 5'-phosphate oxidase [Acidobacteriota bacterium]